jgi:DNA-binding transcriptional LysR family regulator
MRNLTLRSLRVLEAAASTGNYSRAGELLGLTQSAVSQQIRQLEDETGLRLFDTHARPVRLTEAGEELLRHTRVILAQVSVAEDALSTLDGRIRGQLHMGVVSPSQYFMPTLLAAFRRLHPDLRLKLTLDRRDTLLALLADRRVDMVVGGYPPAEADVEAEVFARHPHLLVCAPGHALAQQPGLDWASLRGEAFVFREPGSATRSFLEHLLQVQRLQVHLDVEIQGTEGVKAAVMAGMGIGFVSAHTVQTELATGRIVRLDVQDMPKVLDWCLLTRRDTPLSAGQRLLRAFVLEQGAGFARCELEGGGAVSPALARPG